MATKPTLVNNFKAVTNVSNKVDPEAEAAKQAAIAKYNSASTAYSNAVAVYNSIPDSSDPNIIAQKIAAGLVVDQRQRELAGYQSVAQRESLSAYSQDVDRTGVGADGETPTTASPENNQTTSEPEPETPAVATEDDVDGFYSDTNSSYILDKRAQVLRTPDKCKHIFFLESYKSIYNTIRDIESDEGVDNSTNKDRDVLQDSIRFDTSKIKITINRSGTFRASSESKSDYEFDFTVYLPPNEGRAKEEYMVDSCLWCATSFTEKFAQEPEEYNTELTPASTDSTFTFPVFFVSDVKAKKLSPLYNIKYHNIYYDPDTKVVDMVFWTNVRSGWLSDTTGNVEFYSAYPFTRERDLRNVGRVLMAVTGWYDTALITITTKNDNDEDVNSQFRRKMFIFNTPYIVHNPGLGGEFDNNQYEPVVDSIPWGFKFVEFTS